MPPCPRLSLDFVHAMVMDLVDATDAKLETLRNTMLSVLDTKLHHVGEELHSLRSELGDVQAKTEKDAQTQSAEISQVRDSVRMQFTALRHSDHSSLKANSTCLAESKTCRFQAVSSETSETGSMISSALVEPLPQAVHREASFSSNVAWPAHPPQADDVPLLLVRCVHQTRDLSHKVTEVDDEVQGLRGKMDDWAKVFNEISHRFDVFLKEHESVKYRVGVDFLSLARGIVKNKHDLQTIGWTTMQGGHHVSRATRYNEKSKTTALESFENSFEPQGYFFHLTVWDASILLGHPLINAFANCFLLIGLVTNICLQCLFCWIVSSLPSDLNDYTDGSVAAFHVWRDSASWSTVDIFCSFNETVPRADFHAWNILQDATKYTATTLQAAQHGPLLCVIVLIAWTLNICKIIRIAVDFMVAVQGVYEKDSKVMLLEQHLQRYTISHIPASRVSWALFLGTLQVAISMVLLVVGGLWLATTTRSSDLVLNAVALSYIMEIDELIFFTVVPRQVHDVISNLEPLPCNRLDILRKVVPPQFPLGATLALTGMATFVCVLSFMALDDHVQHVHGVVSAICGV